MTKEQWETCQQLVEAGLIEAALPSLINEFKTRLSSEQFAMLGDIESVLRGWSPDEKDLPIRGFVDNLINMVQKGMIKGIKQ